MNNPSSPVFVLALRKERGQPASYFCLVVIISRKFLAEQPVFIQVRKKKEKQLTGKERMKVTEKTEVTSRGKE